MNVYRNVCAAVVGVALVSTGPAMAGVLDKQAVKSNEVIGPAAKGDPKPYHAQVVGTCSIGLCTVNFGKKPKVRHIRMITCALVADEEPQLGGVIFGELMESDIRFFMPLASVAPNGAGKVAAFEFKFDFDVPAGTKMQVILQASGTPTTGICTATGTLE